MGSGSFAVGPHLPLLAHSDTAVDRYPQLHSQQTLLLRDPVPDVLQSLGPAASPGLVRFVEILGKSELPPSYGRRRRERPRVPPVHALWLMPAHRSSGDRGPHPRAGSEAAGRLESAALQMHQTLAQVLRYAAHLLVWNLAVLLPAGLARWAQYAPHRAVPLDRCVFFGWGAQRRHVARPVSRPGGFVAVA